MGAAFLGSVLLPDEHPARPAAPSCLIPRIRLRSPAPCLVPGGAAAAATGTM